MQERARELAVLESLDNGKPIKESRDVDVPLVAAHFFYYAGWADKLDYAGFGTDPKPLGVAGQVIPWNFPLLMLAWKIAPALACGNTVVLKPAETTPLTALLFAEICQQADLPPGVVNIVTGAGDDRPRAGRAPGRRQGRVHRLDRGRQGDRPLHRRHEKKVTLELGGKAANIVFDDAPIDQAVEGIVNGIFFNQGHVCCAGSRLLVQESAPTRSLLAAQAPAGDAARRRPAGQEHRRRRDQLRRAARPDPRAVRRRRGRGRRALVARLRAARQRLLVPADVFTGVSQAHRIAREEIFGPVLSVLTFRTPAEAVEKANNTPYGLSAGVWTDKGSRILWMADQLRAGVVWANTFNRSTRRRRSAATRSPATAARAAGTGWRPTCDVMSRLDVRKTYKLCIGGEFPRSESGRSYAVDRPPRALPRQRRAGLAQGRPRRGRRGPQGVRRLVGATAYNRGQVLYRVAEVIEGRRAPVRRRGRGPARGSPPQGRGRRGRGDRPLGLVRRLGGQDRPGARRREPGRRRRTSTSRCRSRPASSAVLAPQESSLLGLVSVVAPVDRHRQHRRGARREQRPLPAITLAEVLATSDVPGGVVNVLTGPHGRDRAVAGVAHGRQRDRPGRAPATTRSPSWRWRRPTTSSACVRPRADRLDAEPGLARMLALLETKTVWHPIGV